MLPLNFSRIMRLWSDISFYDNQAKDVIIMRKQYVFVDLDGTLLDHKTNRVPSSALDALKMAQDNGHEIILTTGRPPALFYEIDKQLGIDSFIAANGRVVVYKGEIVFERAIPEELLERLRLIATEERLDIAYESMDDFVLESTHGELYKTFCDHFNLRYPRLEPGYYKRHHVYQVNLFYDKGDFKRFESMIPELTFEYSCPFGIDVNTGGGFKEIGIREIMRHQGIDLNDVIAIGDGFNDISMLQFTPNSVAMGNAHEDVRKHAKMVTDHIDKDGLYKAFERLGLMQKKE